MKVLQLLALCEVFLLSTGSLFLERLVWLYICAIYGNLNYQVYLGLHGSDLHLKKTQICTKSKLKMNFLKKLVPTYFLFIKMGKFITNTYFEMFLSGLFFLKLVYFHATLLFSPSTQRAGFCSEICLVSVKFPKFMIA